MKFFANVIPVQKTTIPWGWKNRRTLDGVFVETSPGAIRMPKLASYFDWHQYIVEDMALGRPFGTRNMKSIFVTASRFMGWEMLLLEQPDLAPITEGFIEWNSRLAASWDGLLKWFMIGDEIAYNRGLLINPTWYRDWIKPQHAKLIKAAHAWGMKVIWHSDGDLWDVIDDLAELGVSVVYYQSVGRMETIRSLPEVITHGWTGRLLKGMLFVENDDSDRPNWNMLKLQVEEQK